MPGERRVSRFAATTIGEADTKYLEGHVDEVVFCAVSDTILQEARFHQNRRFVLDCARVTGFSALALVDLAWLIKQVRELHCELVLVNLRERIQKTTVDCLLDVFVSPALAEPLKDMLQTARASSAGVVGRPASVN